MTKNSPDTDKMTSPTKTKGGFFFFKKHKKSEKTERFTFKFGRKSPSISKLKPVDPDSGKPVDPTETARHEDPAKVKKQEKDRTNVYQKSLLEEITEVERDSPIKLPINPVNPDIISPVNPVLVHEAEPVLMSHTVTISGFKEVTENPYIHTRKPRPASQTFSDAFPEPSRTFQARQDFFPRSKSDHLSKFQRAEPLRVPPYDYKKDSSRQLLDELMKKSYGPIVCRGLVKERAKLFEHKIEENVRRAEDMQIIHRGSGNKVFTDSIPPRLTTPKIESKGISAMTVSTSSSNSSWLSKSSAATGSSSDVWNKSFHPSSKRPTGAKPKSRKTRETTTREKKSSPSSENERDDFLIDDDYVDQPDLTLGSLHEPDSLEEAIATGGGEEMLDLFPLRSRHPRSSLESLESLESDEESRPPGSSRFGSSMGYSKRVTGSNWAKQDTNKNKPLRSVSMEDPDCQCKEMLNSHLNQDILAIKTYLLRLRRVLQEAETVHPRHKNNVRHDHHGHSMATHGHSMAKSSNKACDEEMSDLKRQVIYLQQQLEDKDHTIRKLKRQMQYQSPVRTPPGRKHIEMSNMATQTDK